MFIVLGASGNTGKVVAETLLAQKKKVRVVLRDAAKGQAWKEAGADVSIADVEDGAALKRAFSGAEGAYVLLPPNFGSSQVRVDNNRRASAIAAACSSSWATTWPNCPRASRARRPTTPWCCWTARGN